MSNPKISVLMPVYNSAAHLREAIDSILAQTFSDFEFVIVNDGSTDNSVEIIESYKDPRIKLFHNERNLDLVKTLNKGWDLCKGEFIARMDGDDIAHPNRFQVQLDFMEANPQIGVCGSGFKMFEGADVVNINPETPEAIKTMLFFVNCIAHPTVMFRKSLLDKFNLKYEQHLSEDYELWQRSSFYFDLYNLKDVLLDYRVAATSYSQVNTKKVWPIFDELNRKNAERLGITPTKEELEFHKILGNKLALKPEQYKIGGAYLSRIMEANDRLKIYPVFYFNFTILSLWLYSFKLVKTGNLKKIALYWNVPLYFFKFLAKRKTSYKFVLERLLSIRIRL